MFPKFIVEAVMVLRGIYKGKKSCVVMNFPVIEILKYYRDKEVSIKLYYASNILEIQPPDIRYVSKISFFDFEKKERRWTRNKDFLFSIVKDLKQCGLWELVRNKSFIVVNKENDKIDSASRLKILKEHLNKDSV